MNHKDARTSNIRRLVAAHGGPTSFANAFGHGRWTQAQVSQWVSERSPKPVGDRLAKTIEEALRLEPGSLDRIADPQSQPAGLDPDRLRSSIRFLRDVFKAQHIDFDAAEQAELIAAVYMELETPSESSLVSMSIRYGKMLDGGSDGRQREVGSAGEEDRPSAEHSAKPKAKTASGSQ